MERLILVAGSLIFLALALVSGCTSLYKAAPLRPQRIYISTLSMPCLYDIVKELIEKTYFRKNSFRIVNQRPSRGYFATNWIYYNGDKHGLVRWKERRMYEVYVEPDRVTPNRHLVFLLLHVQHKAPVSNGWEDKNIVPEEDKNYLELLESIDLAVQENGGHFVWMHRSSVHR